MGKQKKKRVPKRINDNITVDHYTKYDVNQNISRSGTNKGRFVLGGHEYYHKPKIGQQRTIKTTIPIDRPPGRPTSVENIIVNELVRNAAVLKGWLIMNNRVATGNAVNSIKVKVRRSKAAKALVNDNLNVKNIGGIDESINLEKVAKIAKATDVGYVKGVIVGVPYLKFALRGRGAGAAPPVQDIMNWMQARGLGSGNSSLSHQASLIANKIGRDGTNPPHFTSAMKTQLTRVSATKVVRSLSEIFPRWFGNKYIDTLIELGKLFDNIEIRRQTPEQQQFEDFI
jgi:hypothetical protein